MSFSGLPGRGTLQSWGIGTVVAPSELFWFESCIVNAIDGGAGGAYAPSAGIFIGGSGMYFTGPLVIGVTGSVSMLAGAGTFSCEKSATFTAASSVTMAAGAGVFTCNKTATFTGATNLNGATTVNGAIEFSGNSTVVSNCDDMVFNGGLTVNGPLQIAAAITHPIRFGTGGYIQKRKVSFSSTNGLASLATCDIAELLSDAVGVLRIADYGEDGAVLRILNKTTGTITVMDAAGAVNLYTIPTQTWLELIRGDGNFGWSTCGRGTL